MDETHVTTDQQDIFAGTAPLDPMSVTDQGGGNPINTDDIFAGTPDPMSVADQDAGNPINTDDYLRKWLDELPTDLGPVDLGNRIDDLVNVLARDNSLSPSGLEGVLGQVNRCLKEKGYDWKYAKKQWLQKVELARQPAKKAGGTSGGATHGRYVALSKQLGVALNGPQPCGVRDVVNGELLLEVEPVIHQQVELRDGNEVRNDFVGSVRLPDGKEVPWQISTRDIVNDQRLLQSLYDAGGTAVQPTVKMPILRNAIFQISGPVPRRCTTNDFGWNDERDTYRVPGGRITASGFEPAGPDDVIRVDLSACLKAAPLGMRPLDRQVLERVRRHIVDDLLHLHQRSLTHSLMATAAVAILQGFAKLTQRYVLWVVGGSGCGKTTPAGLFMSFFGNFPLEQTGETSKFMTWGATPYAIEHTGHFYRDAMFLVDDFKTGLAQYNQVIALIQRYADGTGRDRLSSDATPKPSRSIRGLLVVTAENRLHAQASSTARSVIVPVEEYKDRDRLARCMAERVYYSGVMADFIGWSLRMRKTDCFADQVAKLRSDFVRRVEGQPNADRIANNFALLAAAHQMFTGYLAESCPEVVADAREFHETDLPCLLDNMVHEVKEQRPIEIFWQTLSDLYTCGRVRLDGDGEKHVPTIGKSAGNNCWIVPALALAEVQKSLDAQGRPMLALEPDQIARLLRQEGLLVDENGQPIPASGGGAPTKTQRVPGYEKSKRCFAVKAESLRYMMGGHRPQFQAYNPAV